VRTAADAAAAPRWRRTGAAGTLTWLESRARYAPEQPPDDVARRGEPTALVRWRIPLRAAGRSAVVAGTTSWVPGGPGGLARRPDARPAGVPAWPAIPALAAVAAGAVLLIRLRRRRAARPPLPSPR
jgi:hypothetical protein